MVMQLKQKEILLNVSGKKRKLVVCEAGWDYSFRFSDIEKELEPKLADPNHNTTFKFFCKNYYALMASCVEGEVPSPEEAFALSRDQLDKWYMAVWEMNEEIIGSPCPQGQESEEVTFRDGSSVTVWQSHGLPSYYLKLVELEDKALQKPLEDDPQGQMFVSLFYPKMAASCNGSSTLPDALTVRNWPRGEIQKWMEASRRLNPSWYAISQEEKEEEVKTKKKKVRKRSGG